MIFGSLWSNIVNFLKKEVYKLGGYGVRMLDLIITAAALLVIVVAIIVVVASIKRENPRQIAARDEGEEPTRAEKRKQAKKEKKIAKKIAKKEAKREAKLNKKQQAKSAFVQTATKAEPTVSTLSSSASIVNSKDGAVMQLNADSLFSLLGFDPYAPIENEECEIAEEYFDAEQETPDMRALREKLKLSARYEKKIATLKERLVKIRYESGKVTRYIRDNRAVIESASAVCLKLTAVLDELKVDKKTAKLNKSEIERVSVQLQANNRTVDELTTAINNRSALEAKLNEAQSHVSSEIARAEYELSYIKKEIESLNESVGVEVKRIEDESHAREIMARNSELRPLLIAVNGAFRDIKMIDADLEEIHAEKHALKEQITAKKEELKLSYGASEAMQYSKIMSELNDRMIKLDETEELLIKRKEEKIEEFKLAKKKAHEFLDSSVYDLNDVIAVEDKVIGELEFERVKLEYDGKRIEAQVKKDGIQTRYDVVLRRKVKNSKRNAANYLAYTEEVAELSAELKKATIECEKAQADCDRILPSLSPLSLIRSGSGVISKERIARQQEAIKKNAPAPKVEISEQDFEVATEDEVSAPIYEKPKKIEYAQSRPVKHIREERRANYPVSAQSTAAQIRQLMARLAELEKIALQEKRERAMMRRERVRAADESNKIDRRRAQIVELRKQLDFITTENDVWKFKERLRRIVNSFDSDEANDEVLNKMVQRLMNDATRLGERISGRVNAPNGNRRR